MRNRRVCFILTDAISFQMLCRGQFEYFCNNSDFEMTFISGGDPVHLEKLIERNVGTVFNARIVRKPSYLNDIKSLFILIHYLSINRFDLIVYSTPKALLLGSIASKISLHKNTVSIIRGRAYENFRGMKRKAYHILDKISLFNSNKVIFISQSLMEAYLKEGLVKSNKSFILGSGSSNGVNSEKFKPNNSAVSITNTAEVHSNDDSFIVLIAGRVCVDKGINDLSEILEYIVNPNIIFRLVGPIEDTTSEKILLSLISKYPNIQHVPYTDAIEQYFKQADLHLFLTHREGFGNVAIEAASCGVPTFAYDVIGVKDSVKEGVTGRKFELKKNRIIAQAIDEASKDLNFKTKYPYARAWVVENFEQEKVWQNYLNFYNSIL